MWKDKVRRLVDDTLVARSIRQSRSGRRTAAWRAGGSAVPTPHLVKSNRIRELAAKFSCHTFVESGTCLGEMVVATLHDFREIHSIELSPTLAARSRDRLCNRAHVTIHEGDSAVVLPQIMAGLQNRALIWLDAHYSGNLTARGAADSPIAQELATIARYPGHVLLIDDAQEFVGRGGYPTIGEMRELAREYFPGYHFDIRDHIIEVLPSA